MDEFEVIDASWTPENSMIKVIGVGGGGCNAVNYMKKQNIQGCSLIVCNTDSSALNKSEVETKIQLGEGLGAGTNPTKGRQAALDSADHISKVVMDTGTQMLFITAGMGGGTGTGASPVIAQLAKQKNILTVAVVTLPFKNEGDDFLAKAVDGIHELEKVVDSILIINNEKLYDYFGNMLVHEAFPKADEVLATAVKGIIEIITKTGHVNVDFEDAKTMMKNSGLALLGCGTGTGENRIRDAVKGALESPLLNDFDIKTAKNLLLNITIGTNEEGLSMKELEELTNLVTEYTGDVSKFKRGIVYDDSPDFGDRINITAIATGFKMNLAGFTGREMGKYICIDNNFEYKENNEPVSIGEEVELADEKKTVKIGFHDENKPKFTFTEDRKPCLCVESGQNIADLEQTPAISRSSNTLS